MPNLDSQTLQSKRRRGRFRHTFPSYKIFSLTHSLATESSAMRFQLAVHGHRQNTLVDCFDKSFESIKFMHKQAE